MGNAEIGAAGSIIVLVLGVGCILAVIVGGAIGYNTQLTPVLAIIHRFLSTVHMSVGIFMTAMGREGVTAGSPGHRALTFGGVIGHRQLRNLMSEHSVGIGHPWDRIFRRITLS